ncbi:MAG: branched-chain amino acid transport system II carrier protein [Rickettsiales bacterium]
MKIFKISITAGLAMFSMFFGSGNMVFPIKLGVENSLSILPAMLGLLITGVLIPFLGLYGIIQYKGYSGKYFDVISKTAAQVLIFLMLALLGPLGVIPRCITVATGGMQLVLHEIPEYVFSLFFCLTIYYLLITKVGVVQLLGKFLSPLLFCGLVVIIIAGIYDCPSISDKIIPRTDSESFISGVLMGYHTMDLMAAFFFGVSISFYLIKKQKENQLSGNEFKKTIVGSSIIGGGLLGVIYVGFVYLGGKYSFDLATISSEKLIVHLADITLGGVARPIAAVTIFMACFTTAIVLTQTFCKYIEQNIFKSESRYILQGTVLISFLISLFGFKAISVYLAQILGIMYPGIIAIALLNLMTRKHDLLKRCIFWIVIVLTTVTAIYS